MTREVGRPSKYSPAYCNEVIECMAQGLDFTAFCGEIGVARSTGYLWQEEYPEFSDAVKIGSAKRSLFLQKMLLEGGGKTTSAIFALKNCVGEKWRDRPEDDAPAPGSVTNILNVQIDDAELARRILLLLSGKEIGHAA